MSRGPRSVQCKLSGCLFSFCEFPGAQVSWLCAFPHGVLGLSVSHNPSFPRIFSRGLPNLWLPKQVLRRPPYETCIGCIWEMKAISQAMPASKAYRLMQTFSSLFLFPQTSKPYRLHVGSLSLSWPQSSHLIPSAATEHHLQLSLTPSHISLRSCKPSILTSFPALPSFVPNSSSSRDLQLIQQQLFTRK